MAGIVHADQDKISLVHLEHVERTGVLPKVPEAIKTQPKGSEEDHPVDHRVAYDYDRFTRMPRFKLPYPGS